MKTRLPLALALALSLSVATLEPALANGPKNGRPSCPSWLTRRAVLTIGASGLVGLGIGYWSVQPRVIYPREVVGLPPLPDGVKPLPLLKLFYEVRAPHPKPVTFLGVESEEALPHFIELRALDPELRAAVPFRESLWSRSLTGENPHAFFPYEPYPWEELSRGRALTTRRWQGIPYPVLEEQTNYHQLPGRRWAWSLDSNGGHAIWLPETRAAQAVYLSPKNDVPLDRIERQLFERFGIQFRSSADPAEWEAQSQYRYVLRNIAVWGEYLHVPRLRPSRNLQFVYEGDRVLRRTADAKTQNFRGFEMEWTPRGGGGGYFWSEVLTGSPYELNHYPWSRFEYPR